MAKKLDMIGVMGNVGVFVAASTIGFLNWVRATEYPWVSSIIAMIVGAFLVQQGGLRLLNKIMGKGKFKLEHRQKVHLFSLALGGFLFFAGFLGLPFIVSLFEIGLVAKYLGVLLFLGGILSLIEIWV